MKDRDHSSCVGLMLLCWIIALVSAFFGHWNLFAANALTTILFALILIIVEIRDSKGDE